VAGLPLTLDPAAGNSLTWTATGLYVPPVPTVDLTSYYTKAESDARYAELTDVDPFPQYLTVSEGNAAYATAAHNHDATYVQLTGGSVMTGLLGPTTNNTRDLGTTALRWRKLWAVDGEFTNVPTVGGVALPTVATADAAYVNVGGDTMTGALNVNLASGTVVQTLRNGNADDNVQLRFKGNVAAVDQWAIGNNITGGSGRNFDIYDLVSGATRLRVSGSTGVVDHPTGLSVASRPVIMAGCRVYKNALQSIANATEVAINLDTERVDTDGFHDTVTNNTRLTIPTGLAGTYVITGNITWATNATGIRQVGLRLNGSNAIAIQTTNGVAGVNTCMSVTTTHALVVGDYVEMTVYQTSTVTLDVARVASYSPELSMQCIG
jgi:hypothetical protein